MRTFEFLAAFATLTCVLAAPLPQINTTFFGPRATPLEAEECSVPEPVLIFPVITLSDWNGEAANH